MIPNCYFCNQLLERFKDPEKSGNYPQHFVCYNCPEIDNMSMAIWRTPCCVIMGNNEEIRVVYLYFRNIGIWMHTFYFDQPFTDLKNKHARHILRAKVAPDVFNIPEKILENKMKTWILFS